MKPLQTVRNLLRRNAEAGKSDTPELGLPETPDFTRAGFNVVEWGRF